MYEYIYAFNLEIEGIQKNVDVKGSVIYLSHKQLAV